MIGFWVRGRVRIKIRITVRVRVGVTFNVSVYHWNDIVAVVAVVAGAACDIFHSGSNIR